MKKQLIRIFLLFGLIPSIILSLALTLTFMFEAKEALEQSAQNQLMVQRSDKKSEVEHYLEFLKSQVRTYSANQMMVEATKSFNYAFESVGRGNTTDLAFEKQRLSDFYINAFQRKYESINQGDVFDVASTLNQLDRKAILLQDTYISNNPHPLGEKEKLTKAGDYSSYDRIHQQYHPSLRQFLQEFGYYDIFIVDAEQGNVIYSVFKELDFATSLKTGPYADSGIADAYRQALNATQPDQVFVSDFRPYTPSYESPAAFMSSPIYDNGVLIGVLIFQAPIDKLNELMTFNEQWNEKGLGESGETYLVGPDYLMRSQGRFIVEDKPAYLAAISQGGLASETITRIDNRDSTVGLQPVNTPGVEKGLAGETGFMIFDDYRGVPVLSAYAPIEVEGFPWVLLIEIDEAEAYKPAYAAVTTTLITGAVMLLIIIVITIYIAKRYAAAFMSPLYYVLGVLKAISKDIEEGHVDLTQPLTPPGNSQLANNMAHSINNMLRKFSNVLRQFSAITESIKDASVEVASLSSDSSENMKKQYTETVQIATAITELSASAVEVANNANNALQAASATDNDTQAGSDTVISAANTINELATRLTNVSTLVNQLENDSDSIGTVLTVIQGIAEQTNLLALNAAIEAARAGEQGRGFAVVADEVRTLAARTQDSTKEIQTIIEQLQNSSTEAVKAMTIGCEMANDGLEKASYAGEALTNIKNQVSELDGMTALIAEAAGEQSRVSEDVNHNVNSISQLTEETAADVEQTSQAAQRLQSLANELNTIAAQFKV